MSKKLGDRYTLAIEAPIKKKLQDRNILLEKVGILGNTEAARSILACKYEYPLYVDRHTRLILEEAARVFVKTS